MRKSDHGGSVHPFLPRNVMREQMDQFSAEAKARLFGLACDPEEDRCRQEFKEEADVAYQLQRFGAGQVFRTPMSGVQDFDADLLSALEAVREAREGFKRLPKEVQERYRSWDEIALAIADGSYKGPEAPASGSGGASGASPSDSAADGKPAA